MGANDSQSNGANVPSANPDAFSPSATYRGYRHQALYVLHRIITDQDGANRSYRPEGWEDLYIDDLDGRPLEIVQVKSYGGDLVLSDFSPEKSSCYFYRVHQRHAANSKANETLVSYGPVGAEFTTAFAGNVGSRRKISKKLAEKSAQLSKQHKRNELKISETEAAAALGRITLHQVDEAKLTRELLEKLKLTIMGAAPEISVELLTWWVFAASENSQKITRESLQEKAKAIGDTLAKVQSHHQEWKRSIDDLPAEVIESPERERLVHEYRQGHRATWRHILADADVPRLDRLAEIHQKFRTNNVVILHGASGQGKSTLGYRYMREFCPEPWRFRVKAVANREHALNVATALDAHSRVLGIPAVVLLDVDPNDIGWAELVRQLAENHRIKVLVVVREEDFRRSRTDLSGLLVDSLDLDSLRQDEGFRIYQTLTAGGAPLHLLDFNDAWTRFGENKPLMEFTYFVTHGQPLREKLQSQVRRLQDEAEQSNGRITLKHLELLTLVSVAGAFECRLDSAKLCKYVGLSLLTSPFDALEKEYLLLASSDANTVSGLHSLRSQFILDALLSNGVSSWLQYAVNCLSLVVASDLEAFLLRAFSRRPECNEELTRCLRSIEMDSWEQAGGVARALLWLGLSEYEKTNRAALASLIGKVSDPWWMIFDGFVAEKGDATSKMMRGLLKERFPDIEELFPPPNQTGKGAVFNPFRSWVIGVTTTPTAPQNVRDWAGLGEIAFWLGYLGISCALTESLGSIEYDGAVRTLSIDELSNVVFGVWQTRNQAFLQWLEQRRAELRCKFLQGADSLTLSFNEGSARATFLIDLQLPGSAPKEANGEDYFQIQPRRRLRLLQLLFPGFHKYEVEACGHDLLPIELPAEVIKAVSSDANSSLEPIVNLNATFRTLVEYRHLRSGDWREYIESVSKIRREVVGLLPALDKLLCSVIEKPSNPLMRDGAEAIAWLLRRTSKSLEPPKLPQCLLDEWGFASDTRENASPSAAKTSVAEVATLRRVTAYKKAIREYTNCIGLFFNQLADAIPYCLALKVFNGSEEKAATVFKTSEAFDAARRGEDLCIVNLAHAMEALPDFQKEFRRLFDGRMVNLDINDLERKEIRGLLRSWSLCFEFMRAPTRTRPSALSCAQSVHRSNRERFLSLLGATFVRAPANL